MHANKIHIFLGPTLSHKKAAQLASANFLPPAAMGDITRAVSNGAEAIVLVDGVFERAPSVWHKEILWAISCRVPVIGCSSMGALRAAELDRHGVLGVGKVYESYASGQTTDDDEVAVLHAPAELQWASLTDAMVDIRHRIAQAEHAGIVSLNTANTILTHAKKLFFKDRVLSSVVADVVEDESARSIILSWLANNTVGIKQEDCEQVLKDLPSAIAMAKQLLHTSKPFQPTVYLSRLEKFGFNIQHPR